MPRSRQENAMRRSLRNARLGGAVRPARQSTRPAARQASGVGLERDEIERGIDRFRLGPYPEDSLNQGQLLGVHRHVLSDPAAAVAAFAFGLESGHGNAPKMYGRGKVAVWGGAGKRGEARRRQ